MKHLAPLALSLALAAGIAACGDDGPQGFVPTEDVINDTSAPPIDTAQPDTFAPADTSAPIDTTPAASNSLRYHASMSADGQPCLTSCAWHAEVGDDYELAVVYLDGQGNPKVDTSVKFAIDVAADVARLSSLSAYTDAEGVARVNLVHGSIPGVATITASVSSDPDAGALEFLVSYAPRPEPVLEASHTYLGAGVADFELRLFLQDAQGAPFCAQIHPDAGGVHPEPDLTAGPFGFDERARFLELPGLAAAGEQSWTLQYVGPAEGSAELAVGCMDGVVVRPGAKASVDIPVLDLPPLFRGTYRAETRTDMVSNTSGTMGSVVHGLVQLFTSPGEVVLRWACDGASGTLGTVCGFLTDDQGNPSLIGGVVVDAANAGFIALIASVLGDNVAVSGQTISEILEDLRFLSDMELLSEPSVGKPGFDGAFFPVADSTETWTHVRFRWKFDPACKNTGNAAECGWTNIPLEEIYGFRPGGHIEAGIDQALTLHVTEHTVSGMTYGPLINYIVEWRLLPLMFGDGTNGLPPVDSWDDLFSVLLGDQYCLYYDDCCDYFATRLEDRVPIWVLPFLPAACEAAIPAASNLVRGRLLALDGEMSVGTPAGEGCAQIDADHDRWTDGFGTQAQLCTWDLEFETNDGGYQPDSLWLSVVQ